MKHSARLGKRRVCLQHTTENELGRQFNHQTVRSPGD